MRPDNMDEWTQSDWSWAVHTSTPAQQADKVDSDDTRFANAKDITPKEDTQ